MFCVPLFICPIVGDGCFPMSFALPLFYLSEVAGNGSVIGGVDIEVAVVQQGATPKRLFFWACVSAGSRCPFEEVASKPFGSYYEEMTA